MTASSSTALTGRVALVTGGSGGIGAATARLLAAHGAAVAVSYRRNATAADAVVDSIAAADGKAVAVGGDVTDPADVDRMADETAAALGAPDILVLSAAGISSFEFGPLTAQDPVDFATGVAEQVRAVLLPVRATTAGMAEKGGGSVVVVSAVTTGRAAGNMALIATAKAAADTLVRNLALELGPQQIRVNAVSPGYVRTEANAGMVPAQVREQIAGDTPLRRTAEPDDVAAAALSLVTGSGFVTGATVPVDGGMVL